MIENQTGFNKHLLVLYHIILDKILDYSNDRSILKQIFNVGLKINSLSVFNGVSSPKYSVILAFLPLFLNKLDIDSIQEFIVPLFPECIKSLVYNLKLPKPIIKSPLTSNKKDLPVHIIQDILLLVSNQNDTTNLQKLNIALVCKRFYSNISNIMNSSNNVPLSIPNYTLIKGDLFGKFSLLKSENLNYLKVLIKTPGIFIYNIDFSVLNSKNFPSLKIIEFKNFNEHILDTSFIQPLTNHKS
ncbi:hypothetical protein DICPUDRAFT_92281, partial [Dictyostelium purpureum]